MRANCRWDEGRRKSVARPVWALPPFFRAWALVRRNVTDRHRANAILDLVWQPRVTLRLDHHHLCTPSSTAAMLLVDPSMFCCT